MANPIQRLHKQARDAVPDQRPIRLPWQEPTLGERVAGGLESLADTADEWSNRAADARLAAGDRGADLADLAGRARDRLSDIQERVGEHAGETQERVSDQVAVGRHRARGRLRDARERTPGQAAQLAASTQRAQSQVKDRGGSAQTRPQDAATGTRQSAATEHESDETPEMLGWSDASLPRLSASPALPTSPASYADPSIAAACATAAAARAERASGMALAASNQIAALLDRLLTAQTPGMVRGGATEEAPSDIEIHVDEAARSPLARAADAVARAVAAAGETVYDYSEGHYGLQPRDAKELRHEREKERERARPVTILQGRSAEEKPSRSRLPLLFGGLAMAAGLAGLAGFWYLQRRSQQSQSEMRTGRPARTPFTAGAPSATPAFDRVVRGELLASPTGAPATARSPAGETVPNTGTVAAAPATDTPATAAGAEDGTSSFTAGEPSGAQTEAYY